jgi:aryl-alcohol dehydrogenase-like predicted oxidoreductase
MDQRRVGSTDLTVSVLGFGAAPVGSRAGQGASRLAIARALEAGVTYFDTADLYGMGDSEKILCAMLASRRDKVVISTKCGYTYSKGMKALNIIKPLIRPIVTKLKRAKAAAGAAMASQKSQNFTPEYIRACVEGSLSRLKTDRIDLFFLHDPSSEVLRGGQALGTLSELKSQGKLRHFGVSCDHDVALELMRAGPKGIAALQISAGPLERAPLGELLSLCQHHGVGFIARQPFANGRLVRLGSPLLAEMQIHGLKADAHAAAGLALRMLRDTPGVCSILPSMMNPSNLEANIRSISAAPLSDAERSALNALE